MDAETALAPRLSIPDGDRAGMSAASLPLAVRSRISGRLFLAAMVLLFLGGLGSWIARSGDFSTEARTRLGLIILAGLLVLPASLHWRWRGSSRPSDLDDDRDWLVDLVCRLATVLGSLLSRGSDAGRPSAKPVRLVLGRDGILDTRTMASTIPWGAVRQARAIRIPMSRYSASAYWVVRLDFRGPQACRRKPWAPSGRRRTVFVRLKHLDVSQHVLLHAIMGLAKAHGAQAKDGLGREWPDPTWEPLPPAPAPAA